MIDVIIDELKGELRRRVNERSRQDDDKIIHASGIYDLCLRRNILSKKKKIKVPKRKFGFYEALTFAIGNKIQDITAEHMPNLLFGKWVCVSCGTSQIGLIPKECSKGMCDNKKFFEYKETGLNYIAGKFVISGHVDALILDRFGEPILYPAEIKSLAPAPAGKNYGSYKYFDDIEEPMLQHHYQVQSYMWLASKDKYKFKNDDRWKGYEISSKKSFVIYICKTQKKDPIKIYEVLPDAQYKKNITKIVKELQTFAKTNKTPKRICSTVHHIMARKCGLKETCFKEKN